MINNYIVDFGGVLYKIVLDNAIKNFAHYTNDIECLTDKKIKESIKNVIESYEKGKISTMIFRETIKKIINLQCSNIEFDNSWNSILINMENDAIDNIKKLKELGNVILLSNSNELHYHHFSDECSNLFCLFDDLFFSFQLGYLKPDPEIYHYVMEVKQFKYGETILIDDSLLNIESARKIELQTQLIENYNLSKIIDLIIK